MPHPKFHERFQIGIADEKARARFVNRVHNEIYSAFALNVVHHGYHHDIGRLVASHLGDRYSSPYLTNFVGDAFERNLEAIEGLYIALERVSPGSSYRRQLSELVGQILQSAETDLGVTWREGVFYPSGAQLLDERLANDPLHWLRAQKYQTVVQPFEKGLRHLLDARKRPELAEDVVTDLYESLEALAKIVTGRAQKDLSANQELFLAEVNASEGYKRILKEYVAYANGFRHAKEQGKPRPKISIEEAESFVYLTGVFVRLAIGQTGVK